MNVLQALMLVIGAACAAVTLSSATELLVWHGWCVPWLSEPMRAACAIVFIVTTLMWPFRK